MLPGQTAFAVAQNGASSIATLRVRPMTPDFAALYCALAGHDVLPAIDEMLMIDPPRFCFIKMAAAALSVRKTPVRSISMTFCHDANGTSTNGCPS